MRVGEAKPQFFVEIVSRRPELHTPPLLTIRRGHRAAEHAAEPMKWPFANQGDRRVPLRWDLARCRRGATSP
jgi:hypothetical protein